MNRQDTKYIFNFEKFPVILDTLSKNYSVLTIDEKKVIPYANVYFDNAELFFYHEHLRGKARRYKVRNRQYVDTQLSFTELKKKNNKKRTDKTRLKLEEFGTTLRSESLEFLDGSIPFSTLELMPVLLIDFIRITLVHKNFEDRCTIDFNLTAKNEERKFYFSNLVIAELKQEKFSVRSVFNKVLQYNKIRPTRFSKYCMGMIKTNNGLKHNRFKPRLSKLDKILNNNV